MHLLLPETEVQNVNKDFSAQKKEENKQGKYLTLTSSSGRKNGHTSNSGLVSDGAGGTAKGDVRVLHLAGPSSVSSAHHMKASAGEGEIKE